MATAFFGGAFFGGEFFSVATVTADVGGGSAKPWKQKWRQELVDLLAEEELKPVKVRPRVERAIERVIEKAPADDSAARQALQSELGKLKISYQPRYLEALRYEIAKRYQDEMKRHQEHLMRLEMDDEDVILLLH